VAPDLDGLTLVGGKQFYQQWHHALTHNLLFAVAGTALAARWIGWRPSQLARVLACFLLHYLGDYWGSGPGWGLPLLKPFSDHVTLNPAAWPFNGWQSQLVFALSVLATVLIARACDRTPAESVLPGVDRMFSDLAALGFRTPCPREQCTRKALYKCHVCRQARCGGHLKFLAWGRVVCEGCSGVEAPGNPTG
jgi:hypothetical protein